MRTMQRSWFKQVIHKDYGNSPAVQKRETSPDAKPSPQEIAATWVERNDAQNYVLLGDPAVRLRLDLLV